MPRTVAVHIDPALLDATPPDAPAAPDRAAEADLDRLFSTWAPSARSRPHAQRSFYAYEGAGYTATLKVDYDLAIPRPRAIERRTIVAGGVKWTAEVPRANRPSRAGAIAARRYLDEWNIKIHAVRAYTTGKGLHLRVWLDDRNAVASGLNPTTNFRARMVDADVLYLHALLGDDPSRQLLNALRVERGEVGYSVLWTSKYKNGRLISRETFSPEWTARFARWLGFRGAP